MKKFKLLLLLLITCSISTITLGQTAPTVSTLEKPIWYTIKSACTSNIAHKNYTGEKNLTKYVIYSKGSAGKINYRIEQGTDSEKWAFVNIAGTVKLKNKAYDLYMVGAHSLNSKGEGVTFGLIGESQYWISSSSTNSNIILWNNLTCDRWSKGYLNTNTAFYFIATGGPKEKLQLVIQNAKNTLSKLIGIDPGFINSTDNKDAIGVFQASIDAANAVYKSTDSKPDYVGAQSNLVVAIKDFEAIPKNQIGLSTDKTEIWYYLVSASLKDYSKGKVIVSRSLSSGTPLQFDTKKADPSMLWKIIDAGNGKYGIQNRASGLYIANPITVGTVDTITPYDIVSLNFKAQFNIKSEGVKPLHCQESGSKIVTWTGGVDSPSAWRLETVSSSVINTPISITNISVENGLVTTGIGNKDHTLIYINMEVSGFVGASTLESIRFDLEGTTDIADLSNLRLYYLGNDKRLDTSKHKTIENLQISAKELTATLSTPITLSQGMNRLAIVADISETAKEGDKVTARLLGATLTEGTEKVNATPAPSFVATVFLTQNRLFAPGDLESKHYRIPAIVTAKDGSLVTATDRRKFHSGDLEADIDMYIRRSTDKGKTWSTPQIIAGADTEVGYGDAALLVDTVTGKIFCVMAHDKSFWKSTPSSPIRITVCESGDNGITWTDPLDITNSIYGAGCDNAISSKWKGMFIASGRGLQLRNGRLMFAAAVRGAGSGIDNYVIYSDDHGKTWKINTNLVHSNGDEAKLAQRNNGDVVISIRNRGVREWNTSNDNGDTWNTSSKNNNLVDPNCNGEIMTYTSTLDGYKKNRMLHSLAYASSRTNVSMLLSYDEGETFPIVKTICPGSSAYSTFTILPDGTIGMYYEDGTRGEIYDMIYVRFSLDWLTNGEDVYEAPTVVDPNPEDPTTSITKQTNSLISVTSKNGRIVIKGSDSPYSIYNMTGFRLSSTSFLEMGVYIVKIDNKVFKVFVGN